MQNLQNVKVFQVVKDAQVKCHKFIRIQPTTAAKKEQRSKMSTQVHERQSYRITYSGVEVDICKR